jgi:hypothetical protein
MKPTRRCAEPEPPKPTSWWIGLDRDAFYQHLRFEQPRIEASPLGRAPLLTPLGGSQVTGKT